MKLENLDEKLINNLNIDNVRKVFEDLLVRKTELIDGNIHIAKGVDGVDHEKFKENILKYSQIICTKGIAGKYIFSPFREVSIPKSPFEKDQLMEAKKAGKIRTLSISTIQDTILQEIINQVLMPFAEKKFVETIDFNSFAYRKNKSSKMAVQLVKKYISQGYRYVLDCDIEKFFDKIDHNILISKCNEFFGQENLLVSKYIYRFINVSRVPDGQVGLYKESKGKKGVEKRLLGIPQGGVLSGLLANIFLYDFDRYILQELSKIYNFKYVRYADDFLILFKSNEHILEVYGRIKGFLAKEKLELHPIGGKSRIVDLDKEKQGAIEFLGFLLSPRFLKVKQANVKKFYHRIEVLLKEIPVTTKEEYISTVVIKIRHKIIGLEDYLGEGGFCRECNKLLPKRNWIGYFMIIDDVRLLRNMDTHIRNMIYKDFFYKTKKHLKKKELLTSKAKLLSLEKMYYLYKKQEKKIKSGRMSYCNCKRYYDKEKKCIVTVPQNLD